MITDGMIEGSARRRSCPTGKYYIFIRLQGLRKIQRTQNCSPLPPSSGSLQIVYTNLYDIHGVMCHKTQYSHSQL